MSNRAFLRTVSTAHRHITELDGFRALAVLGVMWFHLAPYQWHFDIAWENGVYFFFVLSGYLISLILFKKLDERESTPKMQIWKHFIVRRSLRILPGYFFAVLIGAILLSPPVIQYWWAYLLHGSNFLTIYLQEWPPGVAHFWTLGIEIQYYIAWSIAIVLLPAQYRIGAILITIAIATAWRQWGQSGNFSHLYPWAMLDFFGAGALVAWLQRKDKLPKRALCHLIIWISLILYIARDHSILLDDITMSLFALFSAGLICLAIRGIHGPMAALLNHSTLQYTGKISYGLYLYHNFANYSTFLMGYLFPEGSFMLNLSSILFATLLAYGISHVSYRFIEMPFNQLKRRF